MANRIFVPGKAETVILGTFPQGSNGEFHPIEWYVKKAEDGTTTLISRFLLAWEEYFDDGVERWFKNKFIPCLPKELVIEELRSPRLEEVYAFFPFDGDYLELEDDDEIDLDDVVPKHPGDDWPCKNRQAAWTEYSIRQIFGWQYKVYDSCKDGRAGWWWLDDLASAGRMAVSSVGIIHDNIHPMDKAGVRPCLVIR